MSRPPNRLIHEKSPYLLQHAHNPVDWHPWGPEAFDTAKRDDKPIFLSIGYSTCYWCHVMEQESFENEEIGRMLSELFVPVKVDREERPDLDAIYMTAVQALSGQGGWPMTVFLTPDGKPFWGGTYVPPEDRWGRPGMRTLLPAIAEAWKARRAELLESGEAVTQALAAARHPASAAPLGASTLEAAVAQYRDQYDPAHGGFGPAPKFPRSHSLSFLLRAWYRSRDAEVLAMVDATLTAMRRGGMYDQLGGGFHRYSTDERWLVPHFEKMLYDQGLLARTYLEAHQATGRAAHAETARGIFAYVLRDLRDAGGAFYAAEDAGEVGKEGAWYVWRAAEIDRVLGGKLAGVVKRHYGVAPDGNFSAEGPAAAGARGANILHVATEAAALAQALGRPVTEVEAQLAEARTTLLAARAKRARPHRDDKILTDWNGLMIGALAYGARVLDEPRYAAAAKEAATFLLTRLTRGGQPLDSARGRGERAKRVAPQLLHRYRDGEAGISAFLDDYAFLAWGLLDLYEATFEVKWLGEAVRLAEEMVRLFRDPEGGGFFFSGERNERLIARTKELYDGAAPSGNSVAALVLLRVGRLTMNREREAEAERLIQAFSGTVQQMAHAFPQFLIALDAALGPSHELVVAGDPQAAATQRLLRAVSQPFLPRAGLLLHPTTASEAQGIERLAPFIASQTPIDGKPAVYLCERGACRLPLTEPAQVSDTLRQLR